MRAKFPEPSDFDLYVLPEKFRNVVRAYLKLMKSVYVLNDIDLSFNDLNELVSQLNRAADTQTNWINPALINCCTELISVYQVRLKSFPEEEQTSFEDSEVSDSPSSSLEKLAATINRSFKLSLNDKNLELHLLKRSDIYFFLGALIKIYFQLNKLELAKSVEKALKGTRFRLPAFGAPSTNKRHVATYLYFSALLSLDDADFSASEQKLSDALEVLSYYTEPKSIHSQTEKILLILLPLKLYNRRLLPTQVVWDQFPRLAMLYRDNLFEAVRAGNLSKFNFVLKKFQIIFLKRHLFLLVEKLKSLCYLKLFKKTALVLKEANPSSTSSHIVPLSALQVALEFSTFHRFDGKKFTFDVNLQEHTYAFSLDAVECLVANLIEKGSIKGYLSHANRCLVLSKANLFPPQVLQ